MSAARWLRRRPWRAALLALAAVGVSGPLLCVLVAGCVASTARPALALPVATPVATTQPTGAVGEFDVQQLAGQIVAGVQAELTSHIETTVDTTLRAEVQATGIAGDATGYHSEFGVGATIVVALTLLLSLVLSHRREMLRIRQNGKRSERSSPCST